MRVIWNILKVLAVFVYGDILLGVLALAAVEIGLGIGVVCYFVVLAFASWAIYAYLRYREGRQEEILQILQAVVAGRMPLVPALHAYLQDRPQRSPYWGVLGWVICCTTIVLVPLWIWLWSRRFDRRVRQFAEQIANGASLSEALRRVPNVASSETRLAAAIGEKAGTLPLCLTRADRERVAAAWLEVLPRLFYPFLLLLLILGAIEFLMANIMPKYRKIFEEFGQRLPAITARLRHEWEAVADWIPFVLLGLVVVVAVLIASPTVRWYTPLLGRLYRWDIQGQVLRALGQLLGSDKPVPESLGLLAQAVELPAVAQRRLRRAAAAVERGEDLADALRGARLLPAAMAPLVRAAQQARTLPWALAELGDHIGGRAFRMVRRLSLVIGPMLVVAIGTLVGLVALAMFMPLITLLTWLS